MAPETDSPKGPRICWWHPSTASTYTDLGMSSTLKLVSDLKKSKRRIAMHLTTHEESDRQLILDQCLEKQHVV